MSKKVNKTISTVPLEIIQQWLKDEDWRVRSTAMNACNGREVPLEIIQQGLKDEDCDVRSAAMNACNGREVPLEIIQQGLKDEDWRVRSAATELWNKVTNNAPLPVIRTIEPPEKVYKKCLGGVIVEATIPQDAEIRGRINGKCRTNKAKITGIIGTFGGVAVGISIYDGTTSYFAGDEVYVEDFDRGFNECSTGFHFFCDIKSAKNY